MDFVLNDINKDLLLSYVTPEEIFNYYTNISISDINKSLSEKGFKLNSPFRNDNKPNSGFYIKNGILRLHDFAGYFPSMDCFDTAGYFMRLNPRNKHQFIEILKNIYKDMALFKKSGGIDKVFLKANKKIEFKVDRRPFDLRDLKYWASFSIGSDLLHEEKVLAVKALYSNGIKIFEDGGNKLSTCYAYTLGKDDNVVVYKIYFPFRRDYRVLTNATRNLYFDLDEPKGNKEVIVTKSKKDELVLKALGYHSLHIQTEAKNLTKEEADYLRKTYEDIYILVDFDYTGIRFAQNARKVHGFKNILFIPYLKDFNGGLDDIFSNEAGTMNSGKTIFSGRYGVNFKDISDGVAYKGLQPYQELKSRRLLKKLTLQDFYNAVTNG